MAREIAAVLVEGTIRRGDEIVLLIGHKAARN
jgi:hypothetical protein